MKTQADIRAQVFSLVVEPISLDSIKRFAVAQRDFNPIHTSTIVVAGLKGPIVHGVFIIGQFERLIQSWQAMDILSLQGRFVRPVSVGTALVLSGRVLQMAGNELDLRLLAKDDENKLVAAGEAKVRITAK